MTTKVIPIGIFDSGYGGLTVYSQIRQLLPHYDYVYLGDNGRMPYGDKAFEEIYEFTRQGVEWLFRQGCELVILACNTASARALRQLQNTWLVQHYPNRRVLGVIRPTAEVAGLHTKTGHIAILATTGTISSGVYTDELGWYWPNLKITQQACPRWVPLIENGGYKSAEAGEVVREDIGRLMATDTDIDVILLACTHYPLLVPVIQKYVRPGVTLLAQNRLTATSLETYLAKHRDIEAKLSRGGTVRFYTSGSAQNFNTHASIFCNEEVVAEHASPEEL